MKELHLQLPFQENKVSLQTQTKGMHDYTKIKQYSGKSLRHDFVH